MIDLNIQEYRANHPKCKWCIYWRYNSPSTRNPGINCPDYITCELKDKIIKTNFGALFCKYYMVKGEN